MPPAVQAPAHPAVALAAFAEPLVRGRRVAVLGDATLPLGQTLLDRGARLVHVYDPDPGRVAQALASRSGGPSPVVAELTEDLGVRDGAFDFVFVADMPVLGDAPALVRRVSRLLSASGVALFASPNPESERFLLPPSPAIEEALGYYDLYDVVSVQFAEVRMLGQAPFTGYSIVDFSEPDPDVAVDTSVLDEPEAPEWYVVVASQRRVDVEAYSIVEIPLSDVARGAPIEPTTMPYREPPAKPAVKAEPDRDILALTEAQTRLAVVSTENEKLRERVAELTSVERQLSHASMRVAELERELEEGKTKQSELQAIAARAEARAEAAEGQVLQLRADLEAAREEPATPRRELASQAERERADRLAAELAASQARFQDLERQLAALEPPTLRSREEHAKQLAELRASLEAANVQRSALEKKLDEAEARERRAARALEEAKPQREKLAADRDAAIAERDKAKADRDKASSDRDKAASDRDKAAAERDAAVADRDKAAGELADVKSRLDAKAEGEESVTADLAALEEQLRERGREIARLKRELREGERVGKELLFELEGLKVLPPPFSSSGGSGSGLNGGGVAGTSGPAQSDDGGAAALADMAKLEARATEIAERAARVEADLVAASWRIAQLEREAAERGAPLLADSSQKERELEHALVLAQREIAELRAAPRQ
ncbi:MAG: hypothetical protein JNL21_19960 [Myxococcales bacterium]|nr:hypothetical protein [Myxococcales bacterium]